MSSIISSSLVLKAGAEPVIQVSSRDRNRIAIQSDLFGAHALGIRNALFVSGDHTQLLSPLETQLVTDIDSIQALKIASELMDGISYTHEDLDGAPDFFLGATFNSNVDPIDEHIKRVHEKCDAGAKFFQTQAIYDVDRFGEFIEELGFIDAFILAGIIPLKGPNTARYMNDELPGIVVPEGIIDRLEVAGDGFDELERLEVLQNEGLKIAQETIDKVRKIQGVNGLHLMSIGWPESIPDLVERAGLYPRPKWE
jgi:methylenetetrahydrofolate reductase (NADPH)